MSWNGHLVFGGIEIVNVERTESYFRNAGANKFRSIYGNTDLHSVLGDHKYRSPMQDEDCPWVDPDEPDTYGFYGFYPLDIVGLDGSTRTSVVVENVGDGGNAGRLRQATRQIVVTGLILASDDASAHAGFTWLDHALLTGGTATCDNESCSGTDLCYLAAEPQYDPEFAEHCLNDLQRYLYSCTVNNGPIVNGKQTLSDGSVFWNVTFTIVAGNPYPFGNEAVVAEHAFDGQGGQPNIQTPGYITPEVACQGKTWTPVFDPACPDLILPPTLPTVSLGCYNAPQNWRRYLMTIPEDMIRAWSEMVPLIVVHTGSHSVRNMRIRLYSDPIGVFDPEDHPCGFCADYLISYIPSNGSLVIDGRDESVTYLTPGQSRRAAGLVFSSKRTPLQWPVLSCGVGYKGTVDFEQQQVKPLMDFSLVPRGR